MTNTHELDDDFFTRKDLSQLDVGSFSHRKGRRKDYGFGGHAGLGPSKHASSSQKGQIRTSWPRPGSVIPRSGQTLVVDRSRQASTHAPPVRCMRGMPRGLRAVSGSNPKEQKLGISWTAPCGAGGRWCMALYTLPLLRTPSDASTVGQENRQRSWWCKLKCRAEFGPQRSRDLQDQDRGQCGFADSAGFTATKEDAARLTAQAKEEGRKGVRQQL